MNTHNIELLSLGNANEIVVPQGTTATYDVAAGQLRLGKLVNNGTIRLLSADANAEAVIVVDELVNGGTIESEATNLKLITSRIQARGGSFSALNSIALEASSEVAVNGGSFCAEYLYVVAGGMANVHADRIDAKVDICAKGVAIGVRGGDLTIVRQSLDGDPLYYNGSGNLSFTPPATDGEDLTAVATGNITVSGGIDTTGGDETNFGRIKLIAGCDWVLWGELDNEGQAECNDCRPYLSIEIPQLTFLVPNTPTGSVTVNGDIEGQDLSIWGGDVTVDGNIEIISVTNEEGGSAQIAASGTVSITGTVNCNHDAFVEDGGTCNIDGAAIVSIDGDVTGSLEINTIGEGSVTIANVDGLACRVRAGDPQSIIPYCGSGFTKKDYSFRPGPRKSLLPDVSTITAGNISAKAIVLLYATGDIGAGTIDLDEWVPNTGTHDVRIYANIGAETADPFDLGGGGGNGCGTITVDGVSNLGGAIAIGNVGGITVAVADMIAIPNDIGTPNIILDGGEGPVELDGDIIADGDSEIRAGQIIITGSGLVVSGALTVSASDTTTSSSWPAPLVAMALSDNPLSGNLTIHCNSDQGTKVLFGPTGSIEVNWKDETNAVTMCSFNPTEEAVSFTGSGNIEIAANSNFGEIQIWGKPLTLDVGTVDITSLGDSTQIQISYAGSPEESATLVSTGDDVTIDSHQPSGNGGSITINADQVNITSAFLAKCDADSNGYGGYVSINANGDVTVEGGEGSFELSADGTGSGNPAGSISVSGANVSVDGAALSATPGTDANGGGISLYATEDLTVTGTIDGNGEGSGAGGNLTCSAGGALDLSDATLTANGGDEGDGGYINLSHSSADAFQMKDLFATGAANGGYVTIANYGSNDSQVNILGAIDTSIDAGETLSGSLTLSVSESTTYSVSLNVDTSAEINTVLSAEASSVTVATPELVNLGIQSVQATDGDVTICTDDSCVGMGFARVSAKEKLLSSHNLELLEGGVLAATNGNVLVTGRHLTIREGGNVQADGGMQLVCTTLQMKDGAILDGMDYSADIKVYALDENGITVIFEDDNSVKRFRQITFDGSANNTVDGPVQFTSLSGIGSSVEFDCYSDMGLGLLTIKSGSSTDVVIGNIQVNVPPQNKILTCNVSAGGAVSLGDGSELYAKHNISVTATGVASIFGILQTHPEDSNSVISVTAGTDILTSNGFVGNSTIATETTTGRISLSAGRDIGEATEAAHISRTYTVEIVQARNVYLSVVNGANPTPPIYLTQSGTVSGEVLIETGGRAVIDSAISVGEAFLLLAQGNVDANHNITTAAGKIALNSVLGTLTVSSATLTSNGDEINLSNGAFSKVAGSNPGGVTVTSGSGTMYWGSSAISATSSSAYPHLHDIAFQCNAAAGDIVLDSASLIAN